MKKLYLLALLLFSCNLVFGQEVEAIDLGERDQSITALNRNYYGAAVFIQRVDHGSVCSVTPEFGHIINNYISMGINGKLMWYNTSDPGMAIVVHPYARFHTSFPRPFPNLFLDLGYDFSRRSYDKAGRMPTYCHDFGLRPGLIVPFSSHFALFMQISFWGYQWTQTDGVRSSSWKFFRHDANDIAVGFCFYI